MGNGGNRAWVWKPFTRGLKPIFKDVTPPLSQAFTLPQAAEIRRALGDVLAYAKKIDLVAMVRRSNLASTGYCLANTGREYLIYLLDSRRTFGMRTVDRLGLHKWVGWLTRVMGWNETVTVDLSATTRAFQVEWFNPRTGDIVAGSMIKGGARKAFTAPFQGDAVLHIALDRDTPE